MRTPFFIIRFVFLSLLVYLSLAALVFAAWNIGSSKATGVYVLGASIFLIFNAIALFVFVAVALLVSTVTTAMVAFECGWTGVMSVLTLAASIDVTISGPPAVCQSKAPFSVCASSTVLVPVSWLIGLLMLGYFLTLLGMSVGHMHTVANIWTSSIYSVPWFAEHDCTKPAAPQLPPIQTFFSPKRVSRRHSTSSFPQDVEAHPQGPSEKPLPAVRPADARSVESTRPWWAIQLRGRPGKDRPFTGVMKGKGKAREYNEPQDASGLRTPRSPDPDFHGRWLYHGEEEEVIAVYPKFQRSVLDPDKPIPLPKRGEWLPADSQGRL